MVESESVLTEVRNAFKKLINDYNSIEDCFYSFHPNQNGLVAMPEFKLSISGKVLLDSIIRHLVRAKGKHRN